MAYRRTLYWHSFLKLYLSDMLETTARKFCYADVLTLAVQHKAFESFEQTLSAELSTMHNYFKSWRLVPNPAKTEITIFHLNNCKAHQKIDVTLVGELVWNRSLSK